MSEQENLKDFSGITLTLEDLGISTAEEDLAQIPSGGQDFGAGSLIGHWTAGIYMWFLTDEDHIMFNRDARENDEPEAPAPDLRRKSGDWYNMYYKDYDRANEAFGLLCPESKKGGFKVQAYWVFSCPVDTLLNVTDKDAMREYGDPVVRDLRVVGLSKGSKGYPMNSRHGYNLISLPASVAALADVFGVDNAGFDIDELTAPKAKDGFNDEFFAKMCGDVHGSCQDSILYKRRAALWASLGEDDPEKGLMIGSKTGRGKVSKKATTSPTLSKCLALSQGKMTGAIWARVVNVANPLEDDGEYYNNIPAITEIFVSEEHARQVATVELAERGQQADNGSSGDPNAPALPVDWEEVGQDEFVDYLKAMDGKEARDIAGTGAGKVSATEEEIVAWRAYIEERGL